MKISIEGETHIGKVRNENQDAICFYVSSDMPFAYLAVADGIGGYSGGALASRLAIDAIECPLREIANSALHHMAREPLKDAIERAVIYAIHGANGIVCDEKKHRGPALASMGTTLAVAVFWKNLFVVGHVGDSRAYLFRDRYFKQITCDHTVLQELLSAGQFSKAEAESLVVKDALTRAIGVDERVEPDVVSFSCKPNDIVLICSDGLTKHLSDEELGLELARNLSVRQSCSRLIEETLKRGARDNISVVLAHVMA